MDIRLFARRTFNLLKWLVIPGSYNELDPNDIIERRKRKTRAVIFGVIILFILMTLAAIILQDSSVDAPISNDIAVALVFNLDLILLVVIVLLVFRNLVKLYFEKRGGKAGSRFQTKLIFAFLGLTLIPSALMFAVASELIGDTVDKWINSRIEHTLQQSLQVADSLYKQSEDETSAYAYYLSGLVDKRGWLEKKYVNQLALLARQKVLEYNMDIIQIYSADFELIAEAKHSRAKDLDFKLDSKPDMLAQVAMGESVTSVEDLSGTNMVVTLAPIPRKLRKGQIKGLVVVVKMVSRQLIKKIHSIVAAFEDYKQLSLKKEIIKASYQVTLTMVTLVIAFSAIWFGFYIAKGITVPLKMLAEATESVAKGNLHVRINLPRQNDEVGHLIYAFNKMTEDLENFKEQIEQSNKELSESNIELYHWGQYIEAVLENVVGGIISIDKTGSVTTINDTAARTFGVSASYARGRDYRKLFQAAYLDPIRSMIRDMSEDKKTIDKELILHVNGQRRIIKTSVSVLSDHNGQYMGMVFVFDDVTDLISAQLAIAWREMARTIAHEIKNPLTPIQLNAQRMRRKFEQNSDDFAKVFDDATNIIIEEVERLKSLVNRFSILAKQSEAELGAKKESPVEGLELNPEPSMLHNIVFDIVKLYKGTFPGVTLKTELDPTILLVNIDAEQIRRVIINLVENAIDAVNGNGLIIIRTKADWDRGKLTLEVADTGHGVTGDMKGKIFQPYFSTKEKGTGLGLAIVSRVVEDHGGVISVNDAECGGSVFSIELDID